MLVSLGVSVCYHASAAAEASSFPSASLPGAAGSRLLKWGNGSSSPQLLTSLSDVVLIAAGGSHSLFLTASNALYSCHRDDGNTPRPVSLPSSSLVASISCSDSHCAATTADGRAFIWSRPHKSSPYPVQPTAVQLDGDVVKVACGRYHTLLLTADGRVFAMGRGSDGALGVGAVPPSALRVASPVQLSLEGFGNEPIVDIAAGAGYSLFLSSSSSLFGCGDNANGQLMQPLSSPRYFFSPVPLHLPVRHAAVSSIHAGDYHAAIVDAAGRVYTVGKGDEGQLGAGPDSRQVFNSGVREVAIGAGQQRTRACRLGFAHSGCVVEDEQGRGRLLVWGRGREGQLGRGERGGSVASGVDTPVQVTALGDEDVLDIALGGEHTLALVRGAASATPASTPNSSDAEEAQRR